MIIWVAFGAFCLFVLGAIAGVRWYLGTATNAREAQLTIVSGVLAVKERARADLIVARPDMVLREGDTIITDESAQGFVSLFDYSTATIYPNTALVLSTLQSSRYEPHVNRVALRLLRGKVSIGVAPAFEARTEFEAWLPQGKAILQEGSYTLEAGDRRSSLKVREFGGALVTSPQAVVRLTQGELAELAPDGTLRGPLSSIQQLISNGDFRAVGLAGWRTGNNLGFPEGRDIVGRVELVEVDGRRAVHFVRLGSGGLPAETYLYQEVHRDVSDFSTLKLSLDLKLVHQSVSGGGYMGSEYPVLVRVNYRSSRGETFAVFGFYYHNRDNNRTDNGVQLRHNIWESYTIPQDLMALPERPRTIQSIEVRASGHDYESYVGSVSLLGE